MKHVPYGYKMVDGEMVVDTYQASIVQFVNQVAKEYTVDQEIIHFAMNSIRGVPKQGDGELSDEIKEQVTQRVIDMITMKEEMKNRLENLMSDEHEIDKVELLEEALERIANGEDNPREIAQAALLRYRGEDA